MLYGHGTVLRTRSQVQVDCVHCTVKLETIIPMGYSILRTRSQVDCVDYGQTEEWNEGHINTAKHPNTQPTMTAERVDIQDKPVRLPITHKGNPPYEREWQPT